LTIMTYPDSSDAATMPSEVVWNKLRTSISPIATFCNSLNLKKKKAGESDDGDFGHSGLRVSVDDLGPMPDDAPVLLSCAAQKARRMNKNDERYIEAIEGVKKGEVW